MKQDLAMKQDQYPNILNLTEKRYGWSILHRACFDRNYLLVVELVNRDIDINIRDKSEINALMIASNYGPISTVSFLLEKGADPNSRNSGMSALAIAIQADHIDIASLLISEGANFKEIIYDNKIAFDFCGTGNERISEEGKKQRFCLGWSLRKTP